MFIMLHFPIIIKLVLVEEIENQNKIITALSCRLELKH